MESLDLLLVEDNPTDAHLIQRVFKQMDSPLRYHWVKDGESALNYLKGHPASLPRVILLDIKLPKVNGLEVLKEIRTTETLRRIPVVVLSTSAEETDLRTAYQQGANSYLVKPESYQQLRNMIAQFYTFWFHLTQVPPIGTS